MGKMTMREKNDNDQNEKKKKSILIQETNIWEFCMSQHITLTVEYRPGIKNTKVNQSPFTLLVIFFDCENIS